MGITGLIPFLEKASSTVHLRDLRGSTVAVDTYCWLHKGVFSCAEKLVRGEETDKYVQYCLRYVQLLLAHDIKPILVFDGRHLPAKLLTEQRRRESRQTSKRLAAELLRAGQVEQARSHMRRCVDVTHQMALRLIRECRLRNVDCIVAPYEADAQLAWLNKVELAQYIITEDSDLTLFGARKIVFKLDLSGSGLLVEADKLHLAMGCRLDKFTFDKFRRMCILSGCDYLDSLPGIGLAKACKFMLKTEDDNMQRALKKIPAYLNMRQLDVDDSYIESFLKAEATFRHMYIYNPLARRMERLYALEDYQTDETWCSNAGTLLPDAEQALQLALGNLDPFSLKQLDNWHPDHAANWAKEPPKGIARAKHQSIWSAGFSRQLKTPTKQNQHAVFFKKVDFISKTLDDEVNATLLEESTKPVEADVYSMYRKGSMTTLKPIRHVNDVHEEPITRIKEPVTPSKLHHNPFAVPQNANSPPPREFVSMLKSLTPTKPKAEPLAATSSPAETRLKRTLFAAPVKSRFFAHNTRSATAESPPPNLSAQIERLELHVQQQREQQAQLYYSPSPRKKVARLDTTTPPETEPATILLLSDDESAEICVKKETPTANSLSTFQRQAAPRLGLNKHRNTKKAKLIKSTQNVVPLPATQSLLSKFGFQRKPVLK